MAKKILFTSKYCGACASAKKILKENRVNYKEVSVDNKKGNTIANKHNIKYLPTLMENGKKIPVSRWMK